MRNAVDLLVEDMDNVPSAMCSAADMLAEDTETDVKDTDLFWSETLQTWVTIPGNEE